MKSMMPGHDMSCTLLCGTSHMQMEPLDLDSMMTFVRASLPTMNAAVGFSLDVATVNGKL